MSEFEGIPEGSAEIVNITPKIIEKVLAARTESGEIESQFGLDDILYRESNGPLTLEEISEKGAIVLTRSELEYLGIIKIVRPNGETMVIDSDDIEYSQNDRLIIFPENLGNIEK